MAKDSIKRGGADDDDDDLSQPVQPIRVQSNSIGANNIVTLENGDSSNYAPNEVGQGPGDGTEQALDAYIVQPQKNNQKPIEVLESQQVVVEEEREPARMSLRTILLLIFFGGILVAVAVGAGVYAALKEDEETAEQPAAPPPVLVIVETDPPEPTASPTTQPPSTQPSTSIEPSSIPTELPTSENFAMFATLADILYSTFYEGIELDLNNRDGPQARAASWISDVDQFLLNRASSGAMLDLNFLFEFMERYSLAVLYYATNGDEWVNRCNFLDPQLHVCDWQCTLDQDVLDANINELVGDGDLTDLIGITGNAMGVRCVKDFFEDSTGIEDLWESVLSLRLVFNGLQGTIPSELVQGIQVAIDYNLAFNDLTGTIPWAHFSSSLFSLIAPGNQFDGTLPSDIGLYTNLNTLQLGSNLLHGTIPAELATMTSLELLYLEDNIFDGTVPQALGDIIANIFFLNLEKNMLTGTLPTFLFQSTGIFSIAENMLGGTFPEVPFSLAGYRLEGFDLKNNSFTGSLPDSIGRLTSLELFAFTGNQFTGQIPDSLRNLSNLQLLRLDGNRFTGNVFERDLFQNMPALGFLMLNDNQFSGTVNRDRFAELPSLFTAILARNSFSGTIPNEIGAATNLIDLHLEENNLTGPIPTSIQNLKLLQTLKLHSNSLTGDLSKNCEQAESLLESGQIILRLFEFTADCQQEVICPCCTLCCDSNDVCSFNR